MMISPQLYVEEVANKSYNELLIERDELIKKICDFENGTGEDINAITKPSPDTMYQCHLQYLSELCKLILAKYRKETLKHF